MSEIISPKKENPEERETRLAAEAFRQAEALATEIEGQHAIAAAASERAAGSKKLPDFTDDDVDGALSSLE